LRPYISERNQRESEKTIVPIMLPVPSSSDDSILIVDDFSAMRKILKHCLKDLGYHNVTEAENGKAALSCLQQKKYRLVISDWNMPSMNGIELLRAVREDSELKNIPFLMVTAEEEQHRKAEAAEDRVSSWLLKPFTPDAFEKKLMAVGVLPRR
jgi:two-component system, chemotaxis family, chemotaxis protein CheY